MKSSVVKIVDFLSKLTAGETTVPLSCLDFDQTLTPIVESLNALKSRLDMRETESLMHGDLYKIEAETIFETMSEGLVVHGENGAIEKFNPEALRILGLTSDQLLGRTSMDPLWRSFKENGEPFPGEEHPAMIALSTGKAVRDVVMGLHLPSGEERWLKINAVPFKAGGKRKVSVAFSDITGIINASSEVTRIFNNSGELVCIAGMDGLFKKINPSFASVLGWSEEELLSKPFIDFIHPEDVSSTLDEVEKLSHGCKTLNFENRYRCKKGNYRIISWVAEPDKKAGIFYANGRDITDLRTVEKRNKEILAALDQAALIAFTDKNGKITSINDLSCQLSGYSREELVGRDYRIVNSGIHPKSFFENLWQTITSGKTWSGDIHNLNKNKQIYCVRTSIVPMRDVNGDIEQFMAIRFDITEQKKIEQLSQKISDDLKEAQSVAKIGSWSFDIATCNLTWSSEHYRIFEIPEPQSQENLYKLYRQRIHKDDLKELDKVVNRAELLGEDFVYNHRIVRDDGSLKYVQGIGKTIKNDNGKVVRISGTCQDITDRVNSERESRFVLDGLGIGVWKWDLVTNKLDWDKTMYSLYDVDPKDFSGAYDVWEKYLSEGTKAKVLNEIKAALDGDKDLDTTFEIIQKSGKVRQIRSRAFVERDKNGLPLKMYGINVDRSREAELELKFDLERAKSVRNAKLASLGEMSAGIAHEINNPLAIIHGAAHSLPNFISDLKKIDEKIKTIQNASLRISKIVKSLRKFSRTSEKSEYKICSVDAIIKEALVLTNAKVMENSVKVKFENESSGMILCDDLEIEQVLINLINNAVDAVKELDEKWIELSLYDDENEVVLKVRDSGERIDNSLHDKIFQPFFTTKPIGQGTGLGLSIVKGILDEHKASIDLVPEDEHTCFEIRFPKVFAP